MPEMTNRPKVEAQSNSSKSHSTRLADAPTPDLSAVMGDQVQSMTSAQVLYLQRTAGNQAVARLLGRQAPVIQPKLTVGPVGDRYEQEADRIASQVVNSPTPIQRHADEEEHEHSGEQVQRSPVASRITPLVQRHHAIRGSKPPIDGKQEEEEDLLALEGEGGVQRSPLSTVQRHHLPGHTADGKPGKTQGEDIDEKMLQRKASDGGGFDPGRNFTQRLSANRGRGRPLDDSVRKNMESSFGANFGNVRVHTGAEAVQMSRDIQAEAFTHGSDIYFNQGKFNTGERSGRHLLAHELTHVVQQTGTGVQRKPDATIQRKWRSPKQWWKDTKEKRAKDKAALETVNYDSLEGLKRGQVLPEVGQMAERRMKDMMKYDVAVLNTEATRRFGEDALTLIEDESVLEDVLTKVKENPDGITLRKRFKIPDPSETHIKALTNFIRQVCPDYDPGEVPSGGGIATWMNNKLPNDLKDRSVVLSLGEEFVRVVQAYSSQRASSSAKGLRPEAKYEGIPGMTQTETFMEERKNVQFEQVTVAPEDIPKWAAALRSMEAVKALLQPQTATPVDKEVGWRGGGKLGDKYTYVKDNKKRGAVGPLRTYLDNKNANDPKIFQRFAKVDEMMRRIIEPEVLGRVPVPHFTIHTRGSMSYTNPFGLRASGAAGKISIAYNEDVPTIAHEVGHIVEEYLPMDDWADIHMLLSERHKAEGGGDRAGFGANIFTPNEGRYQGKYVTGRYTSRGYSKDNAEVLSMWMQFMAKPSDALKLIDGDPQHAALILRMMRPSDYANTTALRPFDIYLPNPTGDEGPLAKYKRAQEKVMSLYKM